MKPIKCAICSEDIRENNAFLDIFGHTEDECYAPYIHGVHDDDTCNDDDHEAIPERFLKLLRSCQVV